MQRLPLLVPGMVALTIGCASTIPRAAATGPPAQAPATIPASAPGVPVDGTPRAGDVPKVLRRLADEVHDLLQQCETMASELRDPHGRGRALAEVQELAAELRVVVAPLTEATVESATLDELGGKLQRVETRISLLHEKLRIATERTSAVLVE